MVHSELREHRPQGLSKAPGRLRNWLNTARRNMPMNYIELLRDNIKKLHGCDSKHIKTVTVNESFQGQLVWQGEVEVFELKDHPKARRCYAWSHSAGRDGKGVRYVAVLEVPPVTSPLSAVQATVGSDV